MVESGLSLARGEKLATRYFTHLSLTCEACDGNIIAPMDVKLAVLADFAGITREGKLNILGIFDEINTPKFPVQLPIFYVVVSYEAGPAEFDTEKSTQIAVTDADGNVMVRLEQKITVPRASRPGTRSTMNQISGIVGLPFPKAGDYQFAILIDGREGETIRLRVNETREG